MSKIRRYSNSKYSANGGGHAAGHVRDAALAAFEAWLEWDGEGPEPTVEYETDYEPQQITISQACGLVWNCTDIIGSLHFDGIREASRRPGIMDEYGIKRSTYGACARFIHADIKATKEATKMSRRS